MKVSLAIVLVLLWAAPAWGQATPLVVGSVRDQHGAPIVGARVSASGAGGSHETTTDESGTFALEAGGVRQVLVTCAFCRSVELAADPGEPVVAIVHRYEAIAGDEPTPRDLAALPYAHAESVLALHPFTVLNDSSTILPGPRVSDRGLSRAGGLLLDAGVPNYDPVANVSPLETTPGFYAQSVDSRSPFDAFTYGDQADAGIFSVDARNSDNVDARAVAGADSVFRAGANSQRGSASVGESANALDLRERFDAADVLPVGDGETLNFSASDARGRIAPAFGDYLESSFSSASASYDRRRESDVHAGVLADRGTYDEFSRAEFSAAWSDVAGGIGVSSDGPVSTFADAGFRMTNGRYDARSLGVPLIGAQVFAQHVVAGIRTRQRGYDAQAGLGAYAVSYDGGAGGVRPLDAQIVSPSLRVDLAPGQRWSATFGTTGTFRLPTLLEAYSSPPESNALEYDRNALASATLSYSDLQRVRVEFTASTQDVSGLDTGTITAVGGAVAWQATPTIALRAWSMHVDDATTARYAVFRYGAPPQPATVGSLWLTYENDANVRADVIWRRDLIDYLGDEHLDASISAPLARGLRWFVGTERLHRARYLDIGIRFSQ